MSDLKVDSEHRSHVGPKRNGDRAIRSFVIRAGRLTSGQRYALETMLPVLGLDAQMPLRPEEVFGNNRPLIVEIGFGNGAGLVEMARCNPDSNFIGIEVHTPGVGALLQAITQEQLTNVRVYLADAQLVLQQALQAGQVSRFQLYFPDPWPKRRHHKRRFVQAETVHRLHHLLGEGGLFHMATDWQPYAEEALALLNATKGFDNVDSAGQFVTKPAWRPETKFERRGIGLGHQVWDLLYMKNRL